MDGAKLLFVAGRSALSGSGSRMAQYQIVNVSTGASLGTYEGESEGEALDNMASETGYDDYEECLRVSGTDIDHVQANLT
jgi:hypothetical protein